MPQQRLQERPPCELLQVSGIIVGMLLMGYIADQIGRKWGSVLTATFMFIGGILLTCSSGPTIQGWAIMFAVSQFIFGYGVGGEKSAPGGIFHMFFVQHSSDGPLSIWLDLAHLRVCAMCHVLCPEALPLRL
jgi:MFS family permease